MNNRVNLVINGQKVEAKAGQTVLEAAEAAGIKIPTLCHHPALEPIGACRVCLIEISKQQPLYPACTYEVLEGLTVETHSPRVEEARRFVVEMLFSERNHYCMFCEMSGNCELQDLGYLYGLDHWVYPTYVERFPVDATRDTFLMDHNRCVLCRRCVRACAELVANHTLGMRQRGAKTMINADMDLPFGESSCISCGTCLQVCPTGALVDKRSAFMGRNAQMERVKSVCSQCSMGCGIEIVTRDGNVVRLEGDWGARANSGVLCQKGRFEPLYDGRRRITTPLIRHHGKLQVADWQGALQMVAERLGDTPPQKVGILTSTHATNEALYLLSKLFREELGVTNTGLLNDTLVRLSAPPARLGQIADSGLILVVGADPVREQPVASFLVKRTVDKGARLIVVDGPDNALSLYAHVTFGMSDLDQAIDMAKRAESAVVLYGAGVTPADAKKLKALDKAAFIALEPGVNTRAAGSLGLNTGFDGSGIEMLYVLIGEQQWDGQDVQRQVAQPAFLVVQASYESPLTEQGDVVLPMAIWSERTGTLTNLEGFVQKANQAVEPLGEAKPDWEILSLLAEQVGKRPAASLDELSNLATQGLNC